MTFSIVNPAANAIALTGIAFTDTLPAGLAVATPNGLAGSCGGGAIVATAGSNSVSLSGATLPTGTSCSFSVGVTAAAAGNYVNTTGAITSTNGGAGGTATANLGVYVAVIPTLTWLGLLLLSTLTILAAFVSRPRRPCASNSGATINTAD